MVMWALGVASATKQVLIALFTVNMHMILARHCYASVENEKYYFFIAISNVVYTYLETLFSVNEHLHIRTYAQEA